jgi:hypothetical protein
MFAQVVQLVDREVAQCALPAQLRVLVLFHGRRGVTADSVDPAP